MFFFVHAAKAILKMNKIKSIYMLIMPLTLIMIIIYSIYRLMQSPLDLTWVSVILTCLPILVLLTETMIFTSKLRINQFAPLHTSIVIIGLISSLFLFMFPSFQPQIKADFLALALAETGFVLHISYLLWYSSFKRPKQSNLKIGKVLPSFNVYKSDEKFSSGSFYGHPTILIFYRGNWCPFCMAQIKELSQQYRQLVASGVKIILISPQPEHITETLARRFNVPFLFLTDINNKAAKKLGIDHTHGVPKGLELIGYNSDTVYPTVIVTNTRGEILYLDESKTLSDRPEPKEYLNILLRETIA
jgi:peroxiredoxin